MSFEFIETKRVRCVCVLRLLNVDLRPPPGYNPEDPALNKIDSDQAGMTDCE